MAAVRPTNATRHARHQETDDAIVRVALATAAREVRLTATGPWRVVGDDGALLASQTHGAEWSVRWQRGELRAERRDGTLGMEWRSRPITLQPTDGFLAVVNGKRYRGAVRIVPTDSGLLVINRLGVEDYLRGVVPREMGPRTMDEHAAVEAQAIAARSYTYTRLGDGGARGYDVVGGVLNQAYGGADAETPVANEAIDVTYGQVLVYNGAMINAPYHSTCGGTTAEASEVWRTKGEPFLRQVSDTIPGTNRVYCERAPRLHWTVRFGQDELRRLVSQYVRLYAVGVPSGDLGTVRRVTVDAYTPSGRVASTTFVTDRGRFSVRANDVRFVLRSGAELLNSTYFEMSSIPGGDGSVSELVLRGSGYGHGVGMCQWGAIGRARAGFTARTILQTYFPGAAIGLAPRIARARDS